jgi:4,5-dihydroxyphthalate decarboxylase
MTEPTLTLAIDLYDRHMPFFLGTVSPPDGFSIEALEVGMVPPRRHGIARHRRMLTDREFDIAEVSLASYIMAIARGDDLIATPVFPRRLFSQNHIFVNSKAGIESPKDLEGRQVAIWAFQVTMSVLAKGDLKREYGVSWENIRWRTMHEEELAWSGGGDVDIERLPDGCDVVELLRAGEIDGFIHPHPPSAVLSADPRIRRLFADSDRESARYYKKYDYYPIMHVLAFPRDLATRLPNLPRELIRMWDEAKAQAAEYYLDPGFATLAFARNVYEAQRDELAPDLWPSGLAANRANLEDFVDYCRDQGLIENSLPVDSLFHESTLDT